MRIAIVAVGTRMPDWAGAACGEYLKRLSRDLRVEVTEVRAEPRTGSSTNRETLVSAEAARIEAAIPQGALRVALDERGRAVTTRELADRLRRWTEGGRDAALLIGGTDGLAARLLTGADETLSLSKLTLPHALARVVLVEQLYRAMSLLKGHPYHRD
jgi:23S rRNA (pseudouridine1915-N3)-methyltransferase